MNVLIPRQRTKKTLDDLAIFGGEPAFNVYLHVGRPNTGERERFLGLVGEALDRRWLTNDGPYVRELEARIASLLGVKHCALLCNGTVALEIAARALELSGEVIVPALTFVATAHALQWMGIRPVFCDVDPLTHTLDPQAVEAAISPRTTAILGVHLWGRPCDVEALSGIARRHELQLMYDAAHAFGCSANGRMIGGFGRLEVFSFHATKFFNTLEGGAITTNDSALDARVRLMRNFGFQDYDQVVSLGTNGKMNEISAAMGLTLLEGFDGLVAANRANYDCYRHNLAVLPGIKMAAYDESERCNYQYILLEVDAARAGISRDELVDILWAEGVLARRYFYPGCHRMEPYRSDPQYAGLSLPHTEALVERLVALPSGAAVSVEEIDRVCDILGLVLQCGPEVSRRLRSRG